MGLGDGRFGSLAQILVKVDGYAAAGTPVEDFALLDASAGHFLQTEGLGAELYFVVAPAAFLAVLVLNRKESRIMN